ncbi:MAG: hypothetical protein IJB32_00200 [Clostridia bacterium]|nr:hypothetical protein [Clostridia bacterium]
MRKIKDPIYGPPELDKSKMTEQEIARAEEKENLHRIREKRIKKAFRALRLRWLKNFFLWFFGVFTSIGIIVGSIFVGMKVIPVGTYTKWFGADANEVVSENIANKSVIDAILDFDEYTFSDIPAIETFVNNILAETGIDDFVGVDYSALKNVKFLNSANGSDLIDEISKCIKLNAEIEQFKDIKAFTEHQETDSPLERSGDTWVAKEGVNENLYCYAVAPASGNQPMNSVRSSTEVVYADVFVNGQLVDALKNKTEEQMASVVFYYKPITELPLLDVVNDINIILGRVEITDILSLVGENGEVDPLLNKIFGGKSIASLVSDLDVDGLLDNLMISDLGDVEEVFGQLSNLSVFKEWQKVEIKPELDANNKITFKEGTEEFTSNPKMFYYLVSGTHGGEDAVYAPAFGDDGVRVSEVKDSTDLYYPNITEITFGRALDVIGDSIGTLKISELLETFGAEFDDDSIVNNILGDKTINQVGEISTDSIMLSDVLSYDESVELYDILLSALELTPQRETNESEEDYSLKVKAVAESITVKQLEGINVNNIKLVEVLDYDESKELYDILLSALNLMPTKGVYEEESAFELRVKAAAEQISINQLEDLDPDNINLTVIMPKKDNKELYDILLKALTIKDANDDIITNPTAEDIKVGHLSSFNKDNIELSVVLTEGDDNATLFKAIRSALNLNEKDPIKLGYLNELDINNASLSVVLEPSANSELYDILLQALTITDKNGQVILNPAPEDIRISHLETYDVESIQLKTIIGVNANEKLKTVLSQACNNDYDNILISDLRSENFDLGNAKLVSLMEKKNGSYGNNILDAVLDPANGGNDITINNIGQRIGQLSLYETYGKECFTKNIKESIDKNETNQSKIRKFIFKASENAFIHVSEEDIANQNISASDIYYIHENDGIWLLICFDSIDYKDTLVGGVMTDTDGRPEKYVISNSTLNDLTGTSIFKNLFKDVTVRQFVDAGIIDDGDGYKDSIYRLNIHDVLTQLDDLMPG